MGVLSRFASQFQVEIMLLCLGWPPHKQVLHYVEVDSSHTAVKRNHEVVNILILFRLKRQRGRTERPLLRFVHETALSIEEER